MERITKTLSLQAWIAESVQKLAEKDRRSFTKEVEVLLEAAINRQRDMDSITANNSQIDMEQIGARR